MTVHDEPLVIPLGEGHLTLEPEEVKHLLALGASAIWPTLRKILTGMQEAATVGIRDTKATLEQIRVLQGRIEAVQDLARMVDDDAPEWYKAGNPEEA